MEGFDLCNSVPLSIGCKDDMVGDMGQEEFCTEATEMGQELQESWEQALGFYRMILFGFI